MLPWWTQVLSHMTRAATAVAPEGVTFPWLPYGSEVVDIEIGGVIVGDVSGDGMPCVQSFTLVKPC